MSHRNTLFETVAQLEEIDESVKMELATLKTYDNFEQYFDTNVERIRAISYSESPEMIIDAFDETGADEIEILVGDKSIDYRERLRGKEQLARRMVRLQQQDRLEIFTTQNSDVHSKFYILEKRDGSRTTIVTSANFSKNGWANTKQKNMAVIFYTDGEQEFDDFMDEWFGEFKEYGSQFMGDLLEKVDEEEDKDLEEQVYAFVDGRTTNEDESAELQKKITQELENTEVEKVGVIGDYEDEDEVDMTVSVEDPQAADVRIRANLSGFDNIQNNLKSHARTLDDMHVGGNSLEMPAGTASRYTEEQFGVPKMWRDEEGRIVLQQYDGKQKIFDRDVPEGTASIDTALARVEEYIETVDDFGETQQSEAVKAQMWEVILWYFWSPFCEDYTEEYKSRGIDLDKYIEDLYLFGETNSGKGTLANYAQSLISDNAVTGLTDGDSLGKRVLRGVRKSDTRFPVTFDDVQPRDVDDEVYLNFREKHWNDNGPAVPAVAFVSNYDLPEKRIQNRVKTIHLPVQFENAHARAEQMNNYIERPNPLFAFFAKKFGNRDVAVPKESDDTLVTAREVMTELYEEADRELPSYFPSDGPAEKKHDAGKHLWKTAHDTGIVSFEERGDNLIAQFDNEMSKYSARTYDRALSSDIRSESQGQKIIIKNPTKTKEWLPFNPNPSLIQRLIG